MSKALKLGSRKSPLALAQSEFVLTQIKNRFPEYEMSIETYQTSGDKFLEEKLATIGGKGLFVKELEEALLQGHIDFAVHSLKDMPAEQPEGLIIIPFGKRELANDAFVSHTYPSFSKLPNGATIGTSSLRREAIIKEQRPDLHVKTLRGNVNTRLAKLDAGDYDAIIIAAAGLKRLALSDRITQLLDLETFVPACGQGILAIEFLADRTDLMTLFDNFIDADTELDFIVETAFLKTLDGGCQTPMAAHVYHPIRSIPEVYGFLATTDLTTFVRASDCVTPTLAEATGTSLARRLKAKLSL